MKISRIYLTKNPSIYPLIVLVILLFLFIYLKSNSFKSSSISEQIAINTVKNLPEVKKILTYKNAFIRAETRNDKIYYYVQIGTINDSHTATSNWYKVDSYTGRIVCSMFLYDKNGKFLGSGETKKLCL